ncbi:hypothetical protein Tco_1341897 [Tanacetum coccineum]
MRGDRVVAFEDRAAFVYELENVTGVSVTAKTGVFLKEIMEKEDVGTAYVECVNGVMCVLFIARERACEIDLFVQNLRREDHLRSLSGVSVEPSDMQLFVAIWVAAEDRRFAMRMNFLREEIADVCKYRRNLINELCSVRSVIAPVKAAELLNDSLTKDEVKMAQLLELERQLELRALKKELFTQKLVRNVPF